MGEPKQAEPWLRDTLTEIPAVARAVLHALQLAREDLHSWCGKLSDAEVNARPHEIASVAFHLRHLVGSTDRLLTYAEGRTLNAQQLVAMAHESEPGAVNADLFAELDEACEEFARRIRALAAQNLEDRRTVGNKKLPSTVGGLLVHVADHAQRHVGQAITTSKIVIAQRCAPCQRR